MKENMELERKDLVIDRDVEVDCDIGHQITCYLETWFDVDKKFGTNTAADDDKWLNLYAKYDPFADTLRLEFTVTTADSCEEGEYVPTVAESQLIKDRYYLNEFIQQLLAGAYRYRLYSQNKLSSEPKRFADALLGSVPITVIDYENLAERFEDEPKILSVMDFDLDDGTVSVTDADGSRVYSLQSVSMAAYQAHRSRQLTAEKKAEMFADYLDGKKIEQTPLVPGM